MKNNIPETIDKYADMDIVEFITNLTEQKSFVEINAMINLFKIEQSRVVQLREHLAKSFATTPVDSEEYQQTFNSYICTWVIEQKIIDRMAIAVHIKDMKGVSNVLRPKEAQTSPEEKSSDLDKSPRSSTQAGDNKSPRNSSKSKSPTQAKERKSSGSHNITKSMKDSPLVQKFRGDSNALAVSPTIEEAVNSVPSLDTAKEVATDYSAMSSDELAEIIVSTGSKKRS